MKQGKAEQLHLLNCVQGAQVSPVTMSHPLLWLHPVCCCKRPLKEEEGILLLELYFGLFGVGSFWKGKELLKGKIAEGKRIVEGKC
jgi:hypothetical protein